MPVTTRHSLRWLALAGGWLVLAGCVARPPSTSHAGPAQVVVARRGWHIDVGLPAAELDGPLAFIRAQFPQAGYVFFGFGDERYVRASHHGPALLAALWPGRGVMLVTAIDNTPERAFGAPWVRQLKITRTQLQGLQTYIAGAFAPDAGGGPLREGPYADSLYFAAVPGYSGLHTCNTWAAEALQSAGLPVSSRGVLLAGQLWRQVRPLAEAGAR